MEKFKKRIQITIGLVIGVLSVIFFGLYKIENLSNEYEKGEEIEKVSENLQSLSQQIFKNILLLEVENQQFTFLAGKDLKRILPLFRQQHRFLEKQVSHYNVDKGMQNKQLEKLLSQSASFYNKLLKDAQYILSTNTYPPGKERFVYLEMQNSNEKEYLKKMREISSIVRADAERRLSKIYWINIGILSLLIISLIILAFFVITPMFKESMQDYQQLIVAKDKAESASKAKSEFMSNMSHELRTPLNGIIGFTDLVLTTELTAVQREYLQSVAKSSYNLLDVINDILDFSKMEAGKLRIDEQPFNLSKSVEDTIDVLSIQAHKKNLELVCKIEPALPLEFIGDATRIKQVLINLLGNALKFTNEGEIVIDVQKKGEIYSKESDKYLDLNISVKDTGIGISSEQLNNIFQSFIQADSSTTREYGGTGLGLTISKNLATLMGGTIEVESQLGEGSIFTLCLPLKILNEIYPPVLTVKPDLNKVLVVDDNSTNCDLMKGIFEFLEIPCQICYSGSEAIEFIEKAIQTKQQFDLIITDHQMPGMDGITLVKKIQSIIKDASDPFILMLSSLDKNLFQEEAENIGINKFLSKPVKLSELKSILSHSFNLKPLRETISAEKAKQTKGLKVVVAEDNKINMALISRVLTRLGCSVRSVTNGADVVKEAQTGTPELIFMDIHMPLMDGYEATKAIRKLPAPHENVIIIALTADATIQDKEKCLDAGMNDFIPKPFRINQIENILKKYCPDHFDPSA